MLRYARIPTALLLGAQIAAAQAQAAAPHALRDIRDVHSFAAVADTLVPRTLAEFLVPGAAVAVIRGGKVVSMRSYGVANRATGRRVTPQTVFNVGSMSKSVTAWGVLHLVDEGKLDLDRPVDEYLTRWHLPASAFDNTAVTVRRLLSHTAGVSLGSVTSFPTSATLPSLLEMLNGSPTRSGGVRVIVTPGTTFQYSGGGYDVLQLLVEHRSGRAFGDFMRDEVLRPLGMTHSAFAWPPNVIAAAATPYNSFGEPAGDERFTEVAAAGFQTTLADLAQLAAAELRGPASARAGRTVVTREAVRLMHTPAAASPGWGLGHEVHRDSAAHLTFAGHNGANTGWRAIFQVVPETGDGLVVLTNGANGFPVLQRITCAWSRTVGGSGNLRYCDLPDVRFALYAPYLAGGVPELLARYEAMRRDSVARYAFDANQLVRLAYDLLRIHRTADAVAVFEANVQRYPDNWNSHDSLAESYLVAGDTTRAVMHYRRSVELNANNSNGIEVLKRLGRGG